MCRDSLVSFCLHLLLTQHFNLNYFTMPTFDPENDCADVRASGNTKTGIYNVSLGGNIIQVFCDMTTDNGGWLVSEQQ